MRRDAMELRKTSRPGNSTRKKAPQSTSTTVKKTDRDQTAKGFYTWALQQGQYRDCAEVFIIYGFTPQIRFRTPEFNQKVFKQYDRLYKRTVAKDTGLDSNDGERHELWGKIVNSCNINMTLYKNEDDMDESEDDSPRAKADKGVKELQKFDPSTTAKSNVHVPRPAAAPLLLQCLYAKLCESYYNVLPKKRSRHPLLQAQFVGTTTASSKLREKNIVMEGHVGRYRLWLMNRYPGNNEPHTFGDVCYVVFGDNFRASLDDSMKEKHYAEQRSWFQAFMSTRAEYKNDYVLDVRGDKCVNESGDSPVKAGVRKTELLKEAVNYLQYLTTLIKNGDSADERLQAEVRGKGFSKLMGELTEVTREKKKKDKSVNHTADEVEDHVITSGNDFKTCDAKYSDVAKNKLHKFYEDVNMKNTAQNLGGQFKDAATSKEKVGDGSSTSGESSSGSDTSVVSRVDNSDDSSSGSEESQGGGSDSSGCDSEEDG